MQQESVQRFADQVLSDLAAAYGGVMTNIGHRLGLYRVMAGAGPLLAQEIAERSGTHSRYVEEWLFSQMAGGYVTYDPENECFELPDEHAAVLADDQSPVFMAPAFSTAASMYIDEDKTLDIFKSGKGMPWGEHDHRLFHAVEAFFRNGYRANLTTVWIPALENVAETLSKGGRIADVGCGHGVSSILMAQAYPNAEIYAFDAHPESISIARQRAEEAGIANRIHFAVDDARSFGNGPYDLICFMDSYHDLGDPHLTAENARAQLAPGGSLMLVEPFAAARPERNVGPVARIYFSASTTLCTPNALHQGREALGAQAGPERLSATLLRAGFRRVRTVHEDAFNTVLEAKD